MHIIVLESVQIYIVYDSIYWSDPRLKWNFGRSLIYSPFMWTLQTTMQ